MRYLRLLIILVAISTVFLTACNPGEDRGEERKEKDIEQGGELLKPKELSDVILNGDYEKVYSQTSKTFQDQVTLKQFRKLGEDFNKVVTKYILQSENPYGNGAKQYIWIDESGSKGMMAIVGEDDIFQILQMKPLALYPETDNIYTKTVFDFPFQDQWFVFWGGMNSLVNYHYEFENQRYAYDFLIRNDYSTYEGDPTLNESYFAFGKEYLAPADGIVVKVENGVKDNNPVGKMNREQPFGNYVILDHGNKEFSYLVHFKYQTVVVEEGDKVKKGDLLGLVGNSGNSSEPHIHFHVADSPDPMTSKSINITFDRKDKFIQGDFVE